MCWQVSLYKTNIVHFAQTTFTAPFLNIRILKVNTQPTSDFFATVNKMFATSFQLLTTAERAVIKSLSTVQTTKLGRSRKLGGAAEHLIDGSEN